MNTFCTISDYRHKNKTIENTIPKTQSTKKMDRLDILLEKQNRRIEQYAKEEFDKNFGYTIQDYE